MAQIEIDPDLAEHFRQHQERTGETPSDLIRRLMGKRLSRLSTATKTRRSGTVLDLFLRILSEIHQRYPERFGRITGVAGAQRIYFARAKEEIERSGSSTHPVQIPGTEWWVTSNTSTDRKTSMLREVLDAVVPDPAERVSWLEQFQEATDHPDRPPECPGLDTLPEESDESDDGPLI